MRIKNVTLFLFPLAFSIVILFVSKLMSSFFNSTISDIRIIDNIKNRKISLRLSASSNSESKYGKISTSISSLFNEGLIALAIFLCLGKSICVFLKLMYCFKALIEMLNVEDARFLSINDVR